MVRVQRLTRPSALAVFAQDYVRKGDRVFVEGRLSYDSYDRNSVTLPTAEITVRELVLLSSPKDSATEAEDEL